MSFLLSRVVRPSTKQDQHLHYPFAPLAILIKRVMLVLHQRWCYSVSLHTFPALLPQNTQLPNVSRILYLFLGCSSKSHSQEYPQWMKLPFKKRKRRKSYLFEKGGPKIPFIKKSFLKEQDPHYPLPSVVSGKYLHNVHGLCPKQW